MKKKGSALLVVVIIMGIVFMMAAMMIESTIKSSRNVNNNNDDMQGYYCAESGISDAINYVCDTLNSGGVPIGCNLSENNLFSLNEKAAYNVSITIPQPQIVSSGKQGNGNNGNHGNDNNGNGNGNNGNGNAYAYGHYKKAKGKNKSSQTIIYNNVTIQSTGVYGNKAYVIEEVVNITSDINGCEVDILTKKSYRK